MDIFLFKLCCTPLIIAGATLASRRWGAATGGWLAGLPLTSGPISVFLAWEQGTRFAVEAACGSLLSIPALTAFAVVYDYACLRLSCPATLFLALTAYALSFGTLSLMPLSAPSAFFLAITLLWVALRFRKKPRSAVAERPVPWWDMLLRTASATALVLAVTAVAGQAGSTLSGMLSCFPILICVMTVFAHVGDGPDGAQQILYGTITACFPFAVFYMAVALCLPHLPLVISYTLALLAMFSAGRLARIPRIGSSQNQ
jgi:hypothetical protein